jgi:hypothetical protein
MKMVKLKDLKIHNAHIASSKKETFSVLFFLFPIFDRIIFAK